MYAYADKKHTIGETKKTDPLKTPMRKSRPAPNTTGIPNDMKTRFENLSGFSFDDVRVHYNSDKPAQLQALAYTQGNQVFVARGQEKHLAHELGHVVQQKQGIVRPTAVINGMAVNDDRSLEQDADNAPQTRVRHADSQAFVVQRKVAKAGIELETAGVEVLNKDGNEPDKGERVIILGSGSSIQVDTGDLEYVSIPFDSANNLFTDLDSGIEELLYLYKLARNEIAAKAGDFAEQILPTGQSENEYTMFSRPIGGNKFRLKKTKSGLLAKPQMTLQIKKDGLANFVLKAQERSVRYRSYTKIKSKDEDGTYTVEQAEDSHFFTYSETVTAQVIKGFAFIDGIAATIPAKSLAKMSWFIIKCAMLIGPTKGYYKGRFPIMPRTSLKSLYNAMTPEDRHDFVRIFLRMKADGYLSGEIKNYTFDGYQNPQYDPDDHARMIITAAEAFQSIFNDNTFRVKRGSPEGMRYESTRFTKGGVSPVDALSSKEMASSGDAGSAVGAYRLPADSDGIFEIRGMPFVSLDNKEQVKNVFLDVLKHYSNEETEADCIG